MYDFVFVRFVGKCIRANVVYQGIGFKEICISSNDIHRHIR